MYFTRSSKRKPEINVVPMLDVIFFLLIFFMLFTTFRTDTQGFNLNLPKAVTGDNQPSQLLTVTVTEDGTIFVKDRRADADLVKSEVASYLESHPHGVVLLKADETVRYRYVVKAMDAIRAAGGYRIALAVEKESL
ncbi:MAG: biopolymer transporter ExbD [Firmicutes bacterium]|nr:biopolymer transporter ExbD [Bacillota bacterium]